MWDRDVRHSIWDRRPETGDMRQGTVDMRKETKTLRWETGDGSLIMQCCGAGAGGVEIIFGYQSRSCYYLFRLLLHWLRSPNYLLDKYFIKLSSFWRMPGQIKCKFLPRLRNISCDITFTVQFLCCGTKKISHLSYLGPEMEPEPK